MMSYIGDTAIVKAIAPYILGLPEEALCNSLSYSVDKIELIFNNWVDETFTNVIGTREYKRSYFNNYPMPLSLSAEFLNPAANRRLRDFGGTASDWIIQPDTEDGICSNGYNRVANNTLAWLPSVRVDSPLVPDKTPTTITVTIYEELPRRVGSPPCYFYPDPMPLQLSGGPRTFQYWSYFPNGELKWIKKSSGEYSGGGFPSSPYFTRPWHRLLSAYPDRYGPALGDLIQLTPL